MDWFDYVSWGEVYVFSEWAIRLVMLVIVPIRRSPEAARGWLLLILFLPWVGLVAYLFIGQATYPRWRMQRFAQLTAMLRGVQDRLQAHFPRFRLGRSSSVSPAAALVENLGHFPALSDNEVELVADYEGAIDRLIDDIDLATDHVHLLYYIFSDDYTGRKVIAALARAVERGVVCRVLIDFLGSHSWSRSLDHKLAAAGVQMHRVLEVNFFRRKSARADLRNHRKIAVIDARVGYTGSQNLTNAKYVEGITYEEMVVRVTGPVVLELQAVFVADWFMETDQALDAPNIFPEPVAAAPAAGASAASALSGPTGAVGGVPAQVLPSGPDYPATNVQRLVVALIHWATRRVVITTPYFIPDQAFLQALDTAVRRGVEVHLVVSRRADQLLVSLAQKSYYDELLEMGVRIHLYRAKFLHAKHLSIDDSVTVIGSSNMDIRSFFLNAEITLVLYDRVVAAQLRQHQERYFARASLLTPEVWGRRSLAAKVIENLARLMSPLL
jgi:cardiolipin synthase